MIWSKQWTRFKAILNPKAWVGYRDFINIFLTSVGIQTKLLKHFYKIKLYQFIRIRDLLYIKHSLIWWTLNMVYDHFQKAYVLLNKLFCSCVYNKDWKFKKYVKSVKLIVKILIDFYTINEFSISTSRSIQILVNIKVLCDGFFHLPYFYVQIFEETLLRSENVFDRRFNDIVKT